MGPSFSRCGPAHTSSDPIAPSRSVATRTSGGKRSRSSPAKKPHPRSHRRQRRDRPTGRVAPADRRQRFPRQPFVVEQVSGECCRRVVPTARASGFVVDSRGLIATDGRAIGTATIVEVQLTPTVKVAARVLVSERSRDVAIVRVDQALWPRVPRWHLPVRRHRRRRSTIVRQLRASRCRVWVRQNSRTAR